jgi:ATP-binding cassette, subfamily C, bacterial CydD
VLILAPEYFLPVRMVGADYHATLKGKDAGDAILAILGRNNKAPNTESEALPASLEWIPGSPLKLELDEVKFRHESGGAVLSGMAWTAEKPLKIGLIGESGAGKSTLIDILSGFLRPTGGQIRVNGKHMDLTRDEWRRLVSYIPQSPYLFSASLADNIRFYMPDASMEQVEAAAQAAGLAELVKQLPAGLHEPVGNGGRSLSGGQEQRVALARAFLSDRPVILLDEPTAHLDIETEYELKETMSVLFRNKLVVMATHRLHWMTEMDRILVLEKGCLVEAGTHEELLRKQGAYCRFIQSQQEGF